MGTVLVPLQSRAGTRPNGVGVREAALNPLGSSGGVSNLMHPMLPSIATNLPISNALLAAKAASAAQQGLPPPQYSLQDLMDLEHELFLDPILSMKRHFRMYLCGMSVAGGQLTAAPQQDCIPYALHIPSGSGAGATVSSLESGIDQYFNTSDAVPAHVFAEQASETRYLRPIPTKVGKVISASTTVAAGTICGMWCWDLSAEGLLSTPMGAPQHIGGKLTVVHAAAAVTDTKRPQKRFRPRRFGIDCTTAGFNRTIDATHGVQIQAWKVQNIPQTESGLALPSTLFDEAVVGGFVDADICEVGGGIDLVMVNNEAAADISIEYTYWGDHDPNS